MTRNEPLITIFCLAIAALGVRSAPAQEDAATVEGVMKVLLRLERDNEALQHRLDVLEKKIDDVSWFVRFSDRIVVQKVRHYGPPPAKERSPTAQGAGNPVKFYSYVFYAADIDKSRKHPLLLFPHGGVHSDFSTYYAHIVEELVQQGYVIIATEYRGSTGYGGRFYRQIDYGGLETEDVFAGKEYMIESYRFVDPERVGILGWSHGGLIALMNLFRHPGAFQCAYAGVPVSDLVARMGYKSQSYRDLYEAEYHIGKSAEEDVAEYRRRSPAWHAEKLADPLLIHTNTNDEDVNVLEVEHLIKSLKAAGKTFEYEIFEDIPGGHSFDRMDTKIGREIRLRIYAFLAKNLKPDRPITKLEDLPIAAY